MIKEIIAATATVSVIAIIVHILYLRLPRKRLRTERFVKGWREIQGLCRDKSLWADAVLQADNLLNEALKKRRFKGKRMGERMVAAQRLFSNNDGIWSAHNLAKKIMAEPDTKLKESEVKKALTDFREGLKDLGAFKS